mmetsp:Transcript_584/g.829  ORF Transcript_584/g.829 Transcript_584/m.829 type:complete len:372 (+) Transcript_584:81-1196(+)|eukprot:CAMPEP_0196132970 /NCGR_PEP_ID=MMETSP0910-20130528/2383_1 /TAXON_ID=49265 /ORGANISM="Thalassiosira rotula, Strain GSO102" /LENGTH=371 /DNA_ID=CAMNT_0041392639 /DNA_START=88 /DNA_END=1203 /DNA_ORIENTATION=+
MVMAHDGDLDHINHLYESAIDRAKKSIAPQHKLEDWNEGGKYRYRKGAIATSGSSVALNGANGRIFEDNVTRVPGCTFENDVHGDDLPHVPAVLTGLLEEWPTLEFSKSERQVSLDGGPSFARMSMCSGKVTLDEYHQYCTSGQADHDIAPLYVFDPDILKSKSTTNSFPTPPCFSKDAMACIDGSQYRPLPPAWLLVGAARSGTPIHDHPMTVAWNALLVGCKLWCCLPPDVDESVLLLNLDDDEGDNISSDNAGSQCDDFDLSAIEWFHQCEELPGDARIIVQRPGEVVYLPAGWFHVVLNVEASTAISVSLALRRDLPTVLPLLRTYDADFATFWVDCMSEEQKETLAGVEEEDRRSGNTINASAKHK